LLCFIFNDLKALKMAAHSYAAETLNKSEFFLFFIINHGPCRMHGSGIGMEVAARFTGPQAWAGNLQ
jgi:hypothetical protein